MPDEAGEAEDGPQGLPASMADIFLALIGVVILMLLSLAPALDGGAAPRADAGAEDRTDEALAIVAEPEGLRVAGGTMPTTPLAAVLDPGPLAASLGEASRDSRDVLLLIEPEGHEAAFLFGALAHRAGLRNIRQIRLAHPCGRAGVDAVARLCDGGPFAGDR